MDKQNKMYFYKKNSDKNIYKNTTVQFLLVGTFIIFTLFLLCEEENESNEKMDHNYKTTNTTKQDTSFPLLKAF